MVVTFKKVQQGASSLTFTTNDLNGDDKWFIKVGGEVHTNVVGSRIFAALGFDVDHTYYMGENKTTVVFSNKSRDNRVRTAGDLVKAVAQAFSINISDWISESGLVTQEMIDQDKRLKRFVNVPYVRFTEALMEAHPNAVKRLGPFPHDYLNNEGRRELRGSLFQILFRFSRNLLTNGSDMPFHGLGSLGNNGTTVYLGNSHIR